MALYTPPSLPRTPSSSYPMDQQYLQSLPVDALATCQWEWRAKPEVPMTPPLTSNPSRRVLPVQTQQKTVLPPITHFDHALARASPSTPPPADDLHEWQQSASTSSSIPVPSVYSPDSSRAPQSPRNDFAARSLPSPPLVNWFANDQTSSQSLAEKTCEMVCYLWFSSLSQSSSPSKKTRTSSHHDTPYMPPSNPTTASLQFSVSPAFVRFMQKLLETTQISQSVIVLSLHYIYRMKARNRFTTGHSGSEYRVAVAALMMANKFVDDNTYTNKTWSEVSGIDLTEINKMEKEFLLGIDFGLYVDEATYNSWLNLLQGLVMAKEREQQRWRRSKRPARSLHRGYHSRHFAPSRAAALHSTSYRARSSSPRQYTIDVPAATAEMHARSVVSPTSGSSQYAAAAACGSKRSASDAFHPYSEMPSFAAAQAPAPRRSMGLTLQIPELDYSSGTSSESSASPMDLQSFSRMSLRASPVDGQHGSPWASTVGQEGVPQILASAYRVDHKRSYVVPQHLYYYTLACSPAEESSSRKGRLRYHYWQPPANSVPVHEFQLTMPTVVQSASASPYDMHVRLPAASALPPFSEISRRWTHRDESAPTCHIDTQEACLWPAHDAVPSAPFANAGPPGFQSYATPAPVPSPYYYQARRRRF